MMERNRLGRGPMGLLVAAVLTIVGMAVTGCSDDDEPTRVNSVMRAWAGIGYNRFIYLNSYYEGFCEEDSLIIECYPKRPVVNGKMEYREMPYETQYMQFSINDKMIVIPGFGRIELNVDVLAENDAYRYDGYNPGNEYLANIDKELPNYMNFKFVLDENKTDHKKVMQLRLFSIDGQEQVCYRTEQADSSRRFYSKEERL